MKSNKKNIEKTPAYRYIQNVLNFIRYKADISGKIQNILSWKNKDENNPRDIALSLELYTWVMYQTITFGYNHPEYPSLYEIVYKDALKQVARVKKKAASNIVIDNMSKVCSGHLYFDINDNLEFDYKDNFNFKEDHDKFNDFLDKIHDKVTNCNVVILYVLFHPDPYAEPHVNIIFLVKENDALIISHYEPHGGGLGDEDDPWYFKIRDFTFYLFQKYKEIYPEDNIMYIRDKNISCPRGIQAYQSGLKYGYCIMFSLLWTYMLVGLATISTLPDIQDIERILLHILDSKEEVTKMIVSFAVYITNLYITSLFETNNELGKKFMIDFEKKFHDIYHDFWELDDIEDIRVSKAKETKELNEVKNIPDGYKCKKDEECISGNCVDGTCVSSFVDNFDCKENRDCVSGICIIPPGKDTGMCFDDVRMDNEPCDTDENCASGFCVEHKCMSREEYEMMFPPGNIGEECKDHFDCQSGYCNERGICEEYKETDEQDNFTYKETENTYEKIRQGKIPKKTKLIDLNFTKAINAAIEGGHNNIIEFLISESQKLNSNIDWGYIIRGISQKGDKETIDYLISKIPVEYINNDFWNEGMHDAAIGGHMKLVHFFIDKGASDWDYGMNGAAYGGHPDIVLFFADKITEQGDTPDWDYGMLEAIRGGHLDTVQFFAGKVDNWDDYIETAINYDFMDIADYLETQKQIRNE